jgi:CheY-like chemotaxis protein
VRISVTDQGGGISREHLSKVFDPYFTTKQTGSGLGLTTCYSIVGRHGGHITVESEVGTGTSFRIFLPASRQEMAAPGLDEPTVAQGSGRVLVMDDDDMVLGVVCGMLKTLGYDAAGASDGAEALRSYAAARERGQAFDAVIMDLTVAGGTGGKEAVRELLAVDPSARVIVSSGYSNDEIMADYEKYGFADVIAKPYTIAGLSRVLGAVLDAPV